MSTVRESPAWKTAVQSHLSRLNTKQRGAFEASANAKEFADTFIITSLGKPVSKSQKALRKLNVLIRPLTRFGNVIDILIQTNSGIGSPVWAPLKMACLLCKEHVDLIDKVHEFTARVLNNADRINSYEVVFDSNELVQNAIGMLYSDYVDFFTRLVVFAQKALLRRLMVTFDDEFRQVTEALQSHEAAVDLAANAVNITEAREARASQVIFQQDTKQRDLMRWISGPTTFDEDLHKLRSVRADSACDWFVRSPNHHIKAWLEKPVSSVPTREDMIWVKGAPGTGKSVLVSEIIDYLLLHRRSRTVPVLYFFCKNEHAEKKFSLPILRSLVSQLLVQQPRLSVHFEEIYRKSGQEQVESFYALMPLFLNALADCPLSYIIIDAVDEADEGARSDFIEACGMWKDGSPYAKLRILLTSRPTFMSGFWDAVGSLHNAFKVTIDPDQLIASIERHIKEKVEKSALPKLLGPTVSGELNLAETICDCAQGNWLIATLALKNLLGAKSVAAIRRKLKSLKCGEQPLELSQLYSNILLQLESNFEDEEQLDMAQTIWLWVVFSRFGRPLSVKELSMALTLRATMRAEERSGLEWQTSSVSTEESLFDPGTEILRLCSPLLEIDDKDFVHVVHYSVTEYFLAASTSETSVGTSNSHPMAKPAVLIPEWQRLTRLAFSALRYMETDEVQNCFDGGQVSPQRPIKELDRALPFFSQSLLPIWDFLGDYNYRIARLMTSKGISNEKVLLYSSGFSRFHEFLYSVTCVPWIIGSMLLFGIHDVGVLVTRIGLMAALADEAVGHEQGAEEIWELVLPYRKLQLWVNNLYKFAKKEQWEFKFYETVALGRLSTCKKISADEQVHLKEKASININDAQTSSEVLGKNSGYKVSHPHSSFAPTDSKVQPVFQIDANTDVPPGLDAELQVLFYHLKEQAARYIFVDHPLELYFDLRAPSSSCSSLPTDGSPSSDYSSTPTTLILPAPWSDESVPSISASEIAAIASAHMEIFASGPTPFLSKAFQRSGKSPPPDHVLSDGTQLFNTAYKPWQTPEYSRAKQLFHEGRWDTVWREIKTGYIIRSSRSDSSSRQQMHVGMYRQFSVTKGLPFGVEPPGLHDGQIISTWGIKALWNNAHFVKL